MKFPATKYALLRLLRADFDIEPPKATEVLYYRGESMARLKWDRDGIQSTYRFYIGDGFRVMQTIYAYDRVFHRERTVEPSVLRSVGLYAAAEEMERMERTDHAD